MNKRNLKTGTILVILLILSMSPASAVQYSNINHESNVDDIEHTSKYIHNNDLNFLENGHTPYNKQ